MTAAISEHVLETTRHSSFYLACGDPNDPPIIFCHGWPELSHSWRHQLPAMADLGLYAIAPDMRGYGRSSLYPDHESYRVSEIEADMIELLDHIGAEKAIWVGHDWGTPIVWSIAQHRPERCHGVCGVCVPYLPKGFILPELVKLIDREKYPEDDHPYGQWEYWLFHRSAPDLDRIAFEANVSNTIRLLFRAGDPERAEARSTMATVQRRGGWFGPDGAGAPELPLDSSVLTEQNLAIYVEAFERTGFAGAHDWYRNDAPNAAHAEKAQSPRLEMPVLFVHARYDGVCDTVTGRLAEPMRANCGQLSEVIVDSGHWVGQENPKALNAALSSWLVSELSALTKSPRR